MVAADFQARRKRTRGSGVVAATLLCLATSACASLEARLTRLRAGPVEPPTPAAGPVCEDAVIHRDAQRRRAEYLERETERLRADLRQAEETMVGIESGLRETNTPADAVSALAEARIAVERARKSAPWRPQRAGEAQAKLEEAELQFKSGHNGSAVFFAARARRIADTLNEEALEVANTPGTRFVGVKFANLRAGPSTREPVVGVLTESTPVFPVRRKQTWALVRTAAGPVGWIYRPLLREP